MLAIVAVCLFEFALHRQRSLFQEFEVAFLSLRWIYLVCLAIWCGVLFLLTFSQKDVSLIALLLIVIIGFIIATRPAADALTFVFGITLSKGARFFLTTGSRHESVPNKKQGIDQSELMSAATFLIGLVGLLAFGSWWHLDVSNNFYPTGVRWTGLWDNPNNYGMLMGTGGVLAIGLLAANSKFKIQNVKTNWFLGIAVFMLGVGLVMSYSRGAWVATTIGLFYLAWSYGKLKWRWVLTVILAAAAVVILFWHSTADTAPWYLKRLDFSRPSAQHRVAAWKAAVHIMLDHPLGVGWNQAVGIYEKNFSPPEGGAPALTMNSYLMLGTELGIPALVCFVAYVGLSIRDRRSAVVATAGSPGVTPGVSAGGETPPQPADETSALRVACRAGAIVLLVAFWFDGGLFDLPTAAVFWVLLELGNANAEGRMKNEEIKTSPHPDPLPSCEGQRGNEIGNRQLISAS